jgi:hypothetical protein
LFDKPGVVVHDCTQEAEAGESRAWGQPGLHSKTLPQKKKINKETPYLKLFENNQGSRGIWSDCPRKKSSSRIWPDFSTGRICWFEKRQLCGQSWADRFASSLGAVGERGSRLPGRTYNKQDVGWPPWTQKGLCPRKRAAWKWTTQTPKRGKGGEATAKPQTHELQLQAAWSEAGLGRLPSPQPRGEAKWGLPFLWWLWLLH